MTIIDRWIKIVCIFAVTSCVFMNGKEESPGKNNQLDDDDGRASETSCSSSENFGCLICHEECQSIRELLDNGEEEATGTRRRKTNRNSGRRSSSTGRNATAVPQLASCQQVRTGSSERFKCIQCTSSASKDLIDKHSLLHKQKMDEASWQKTKWLQFQVAQVWYVQFPRMWLQKMVESINTWYFPMDEGDSQHQSDDENDHLGVAQPSNRSYHTNDHHRDQASSHKNNQRQSSSQNDHQSVQWSKPNSDRLVSDRTNWGPLNNHQNDQQNNQQSKHKSDLLERDQLNVQKSDRQPVSDRLSDQQIVQQSEQPSKPEDSVQVEYEQLNNQSNDNLDDGQNDNQNVEQSDQLINANNDHLVSDQQSDHVNEHRRVSDRQNEHQRERPSDKSNKRYKMLWSKFVLLMWKNALLQYRNPYCTILQMIVVPVALSVALLFVRRMAPETKAARQYPPFCPVELPFMCDRLSTTTATFQEYTEGQGGSAKPLGKFQLAYSPTGNSAIDKSMGLFKLLIKNVDGYANEKGMEEHFLTSEKTNSAFVAVVFDDELKDGAELPDDAEVKIRFPGELRKIKKGSVPQDWATNQLFPMTQVPGPRDYKKDFGAAPEYYEEGFLALQTMLTYFLIYGQLGATKLDDIKTTTQNRPAPAVKMQRFPHASWIVDPAEVFLNTYIGIAVFIIFYFPFTRIVTDVAVEKERQLKETMKIMGLPGWLHWTAWFVKSLICYLIIIVIMVIMFKITCTDNDYSVLTFANPLVVFLFLLLYACSCITFAFACSVFFSKASSASCMGGMFFTATSLPFMLTLSLHGVMNLATKLLMSLGMNTAMAMGFHVMSIFERTHEGIQWSNIWHTATPEDNLTLGHLMLMLIIDTFLYLFIALYVEAVFPGQYGVPLKWNYLFTRAYWKGQSPSKTVDPEFATPDSKNLEKEPNLEPGVEIKNLRKVFKNKTAVNNLSLNMYKDQITVLLGHNGAGKTTTMSMLTGMFPPTSGTATISGHDIRNDMEGARSSLGLCPQHDILFDDLTVQEHLIIFTKLKGLDKKEVDREVKTYIELLELVPKAKTKSCKLSGGMKRKLCVGIAFCGGSQVVMLDEPTAGMDPSARRAIWDLIQKQKDGRTILLTTHFMDEADLLGDRIAIMAGGELQCCGSSFFLKKKYGTGYHLIIDKGDSCDPDQITRTLRNYIPSIEIHSDVGSELTYLLAENEADVFENMLRDLEEHGGILGVRSFGISLTTLEEVFMKVGAHHDQEHDADDQSKLNKTFDAKTEANSSGATETKLTMNNHNQLLSGSLLIRNQFTAMCTKKFLSMRRNWIWLFGQFLFPIAVVMLVFFTMRTSSDAGDLPKLSLSLESYDDPITLIENAASAASADIRDSYARLLAHDKIENVASISDVMMNYTERKSAAEAKKRYIMGVSFGNPESTAGGGSNVQSVTAWFNNDPYHSPPLALGMALNSVYNYMLKKRIRFANHPLPFDAFTKMKRLSGIGNVAFFLSLMLAIGLAFVSALYVVFYVRERTCKSKHLQLVSGVKIYVFWLCAFLCDFATFLLIALGIIITIACFQRDGFKTAEDMGRFSVIMLYYGVALLPLIYIVSFWFNVPSKALTTLTGFFIFGPIAYLFMTIFAAESPSVIAIFHWIFLIEPHYSLATGIKDTYATYSANKMCKNIVKMCVEQSPGTDANNQCWDVACQLFDKCCGNKDANNYFEWQPTGIGRNLCYSFGLGTTMFLLLLFKDYKCCSKLMSGFGDSRLFKARVDLPDEDSDVAEEKRKIRETNLPQLQRDYAIVLRNMTKFYTLNGAAAVDNISLGIKKYECFGLLGVNGAGKTTTFQMMTGDLQITSGDAWINGFSVKTQLDKAQKHIGYCPQFDALLDDLTVRETLVIFALLRGVPKHECASLAEKLAVDFDFRPHLNKQIKNLSGGNKRKVSAAVSMIGDPPVVFLDEPTTGMDPATKRHFWDVLCRVRDSGKSIVLTSHSMEECEALCTRLVVMVAGSFKCLGSVQHLKNKYAAGYTLTIKVKKTSSQEDAVEQVEKFVEKIFPSATLREKHQEMLTYNIADASMSWSEMFGILQQAKEELNIEDYSLGQSSLEQVFLSFTKPKTK